MGSDITELVCRHHLHLIKDEEAPVNLADDLHLTLDFSASSLGETDHEIGADDDSSLVLREHVTALF